MLKTNLEHMEVLKQRIKDLESSNEVFALENEDLRQFSLDGYDIAKNVQALTAEREVLSVDLADKAQVIKRLLDENDQLNHKLSRAQDHA
jgi:regulator of replication initiation timing